MDPKLIELEHYLERIGMKYISIDGIFGDMVFFESFWNGDSIEGIFNITNSKLVYRIGDFDDFSGWKEV